MTVTGAIGGDPLTGTINAIDIYDAEGHLLATTNGWNISVSALTDALTDYAEFQDTSALDAIFGSYSYSAVGNFAADSDFDHSSVNFGGDTFFSGDGNDSFNGLTNANGDFGNGDTVDYSHAAGAVTVSLLLQGAAQDTVGAGFDTLLNIENLRGSAFDDTLTSNGFNSVIEGGCGNDTLIGAEGGNETVSYEHASAAVIVDLSVTTQQDTQGAGLDTISGFETVRGSAYDDVLTGSDDSMLEGG